MGITAGETLEAGERDGLSLIDVQRHYVRTHPNDYRARLNYARRLRDVGRIDQALEQYGHLVQEDYEMLSEVLRDIELLNRLHPGTPRLAQLLSTARERDSRKPSQWQ